jgi:hypothetical protein
MAKYEILFSSFGEPKFITLSKNPQFIVKFSYHLLIVAKIWKNAMYGGYTVFLTG